MLKAGSMDFRGQKLSFDFQFYFIWVAGVIGFVHGFVASRFLYTFQWIFGATMLVTVLCLPPWPMWNRHPVEWLEPRDRDEDEAPKPKETKETKKTAGKGKKKH